MSNPRTAAAAASVREQKLARVIDREVAPIWHDRFARMLLRDLPNRTGAVVLDVHTGPGHTTAELLERLDESSRVVALGRDPLMMQIAKTSVRQEWKRRVYFKTGDIDDVMEMGDATYDLTVANLVLGEHVVDWKAALAELRRVTKPGGHVLATVPLHGTWDEVEDLFEELLRDEGMSAEVLTLKQLRRRRPKPGHLVRGLEEMGLGPNDFVVEHERFEMLFRSGREFLFAPVIEHGPLRLWKAILGRAEQPQALFWRFKEVIDTYYVGKVLGVSVVAGLIRMRVPGGGATEASGANKSFASSYWSRYPELTRLWGANTADDDIELDVDFGDDDEADSDTLATEPDSGVVAELEGELPAVAALALDHDPFAHLLDELDAADEGVPPLETEEQAAPVERPTTGTATLGTVGTPAASPPRRPVKPTVALPTTASERRVPVGTPTATTVPTARAVPSPAPPAPTPVVPMPVAPSPSRPIVVGTPTTGPAPAVPKPIAPSASKPIPVPVAPKPPTTGKVPTVGPKLDASKPLIEDDFLDGIDELDELDELGDDEDLSESFGRIEPDPDTARTGPAIPPRAPPKK